MGVLIYRNEDAKLYADTYEEAQRIIRISDEVRMSLEKIIEPNNSIDNNLSSESASRVPTETHSAKPTEIATPNYSKLTTAKLAKENGLLNVLVTNGYINQEPLEQLLPYIDAMNIDLKAYNDKFYNELVKGGLEEVKATIKTAYTKCHVEITTLIIPGWNDSSFEMEGMVNWLAYLTPDIPLHLTRYFPNYLMNDRPPTPIETLNQLKKIADQYLKHVYLGNV